VKVHTGSFFQVLLMKMSITDAVILMLTDKGRGKFPLFLPEKQRVKSLLLDTTDSLPKDLENIFGLSGNTISYCYSNPGFLILFGFCLFQLHSLFGSHVSVTPNSGNFITL